jgi:hypothetical protein
LKKLKPARLLGEGVIRAGVVLAEVKEEEASELLAVVLAVPGLCVLGVGV